MILCVAAEASGDRLLASLLPELRRALPSETWEGVGGALSVEAGLTSWLDPRELSAHGLTEALHVVPATLKALKLLRANIPRARALLLVDAPELNMRLLKTAHHHHVPVMYLAPPQAWAWRPWRARALKRAAWVGCLFEFEAQWYRERGVKARCVGHPLKAEREPLARALREAHLNLERPKKLLLCPGSRRSSFQRALPLMIQASLKAMAQAPERFEPTLTLVLSDWLKADERVEALIQEAQSRCERSGAQLNIISNRTLFTERALLELSPALAIAHAGTITLELALSGVPFVAVAPLSPLSQWVAANIIQTQDYSLPNLILKEQAFMELSPLLKAQEATATLAVILDEMSAPHVYQDIARFTRKVNKSVSVLYADEICREMTALLIKNDVLLTNA